MVKTSTRSSASAAAVKADEPKKETKKVMKASTIKKAAVAAEKAKKATAPKKKQPVVPTATPVKETKEASTPAVQVDDEKNMSAFQLKERKSRTVFVGNVPSDTTAKKLQKLFRACGKIEKIWFRSICVVEDSKKPQRAKIITKELGNFKDSKNAYILYKEEKSCQEAKIKFNQVLFEQRHLRVDTMRITAAEQE